MLKVDRKGVGPYVDSKLLINRISRTRRPVFALNRFALVTVVAAWLFFFLLLERCCIAALRFRRQFRGQRPSHPISGKVSPPPSFQGTAGKTGALPGPASG